MFTAGNRTARRIPFGRHHQRRQNLLSVVFCLVFFGIAIRLHSQSTKLPGCGRVKIWSHRGHLNSYDESSNEWTCDHVLETLAKNDINHIDIDILVHEGQTLVAHPTEMGDDLGDFTPSPCSRLLLSDFLALMEELYGGDGKNNFYITMEPKSAWKDDGPFLSQPQLVLSGVLDVIEANNKLMDGKCGVILDLYQYEDYRVRSILRRLERHCDFVVPFRRSQAPLVEQDVRDLPSAFRLTMPTIELFGATEFLSGTMKRDMQVVTWIIDSVSDLRRALKQSPPGITGLVSNRPVEIKKMYQEECRSR